MRSENRRGIFLSVLMAAAFALSSPAAARAQTTGTTATEAGAATTQAKTAAAVDSTAVTNVGVGSGVTSVASDSNGNVYASLQYDNKVVKLNGGGTELARFAVGANPTGLLVDNAGAVLYVMNNADNTVSKLGLDGTPRATFKVDGDGPVHAALYAGTLYVACERSNTLVRMTTDGAALGSTAVGARPVWVTVGASPSRLATTDPSATAAGGDATATTAGGTVNVYVSCNKANQVWKLSASGSVLARYSTARGPFGLAVNSNGELLVACFWDAVVQRFDAAGAVLSNTAVGDGAAGLIAYGNVVAVIENGNNGITRLSAADGAVISRDKVDRAPLMGTATASALWVGCTGSGTIAKRAL
jgi:DNA-binding beta-propeller fold protein YncE